MAYNFNDPNWVNQYRDFLASQGDLTQRELSDENFNRATFFNNLNFNQAPANSRVVGYDQLTNPLVLSNDPAQQMRDMYTQGKAGWHMNPSGKLVNGDNGYVYYQFDKPIPEYNPPDDLATKIAFMAALSGVTAGFGSGLGAAVGSGTGAGAAGGWVSGEALPAGAMWGGADAAAAGAAGALPESYWSMLADAGAPSDALSAGAGALGEVPSTWTWEDMLYNNYNNANPFPLTSGTIGNETLSSLAGNSALPLTTIGGTDYAAQLASWLGNNATSVSPGVLSSLSNSLSNLGNYLTTPQGLLSAGSNIYSALSGSNAANRATNAIQQAAQQGLAQQQAQYAQIRADNLPYMMAGTGAVGQLSNMLSPTGSLMKPFTGVNTQTDPGYQFGLDQGVKAMQRGAAAKGNLLSGATQKGLNSFAQDYATQHFNDAFNRDLATKNQQYSQLAGVAGLGQNAASATGNAGLSTASQNTGLLSNAGNAAAAGSVANNNAITGALSNFFNQYSQQQLLSQLLSANGRSNGYGY